MDKYILIVEDNGKIIIQEAEYIEDGIYIEIVEENENKEKNNNNSNS